MRLDVCLKQRVDRDGEQEATSDEYYEEIVPNDLNPTSNLKKLRKRRVQSELEPKLSKSLKPKSFIVPIMFKKALNSKCNHCKF